MKILLTVLFTAFIGNSLLAQDADYIIIKKRNNRPLKTYFAGTYISAETYDGFRINGIIKSISNDTIRLQQHETRLVAEEFGTKIDTLQYELAVNYRIIKKFNFGGYNPSNKKRGFSQISIPKLLVAGGTGFIVVELINTAYRKESINDNNKLTSLAIAAGAAGSGFLWNFISNKRNRVGGKYKVVYVYTRSKQAIR